MNTNIKKRLGRLLETKSEKLKLGVDVHARDVMVAIQEEDARPLRPQKMSREQLLALVRGLVAAGRKVCVCYETGPCGYGLHYALLAAGAESYVIVAETLTNGRQQKTDGLDAAALCDKLDRYLRGNVKAMTPVRVPSEEEQRRRSECRLREQLKQSRHQWEARGRSLLLFYDHHVTGQWWRGQRWKDLPMTVSPWLGEQLTQIRATLVQAKTGELSLERIWPDDQLAKSRIEAAQKDLQQDTTIRGKGAYREIGESMPNFTLYDQDGKVVVAPSNRDVSWLGDTEEGSPAPAGALPAGVELHEFADLLREYDVHVIVLARDNHVKHVVSRANAKRIKEMTNRWNRRPGDDELPPVATASRSYGRMLGGSGAPGIETLRGLARRWGGREEARVMLTSLCVPAHHAALVNGAWALGMPHQAKAWAMARWRGSGWRSASTAAQLVPPAPATSITATPASSNRCATLGKFIGHVHLLQ